MLFVKGTFGGIIPERMVKETFFIAILMWYHERRRACRNGAKYYFNNEVTYGCITIPRYEHGTQRQTKTTKKAPARNTTFLHSLKDLATLLHLYSEQVSFALI